MYDDRTLTLYDSKGHMGSLNLDNIALVIDFADLLIDGSVDVKNEVLTTKGTYSTQKGRDMKRSSSTWALRPVECVW